MTLARAVEAADLVVHRSKPNSTCSRVAGAMSALATEGVAEIALPRARATRRCRGCATERRRLLRAPFAARLGADRFRRSRDCCRHSPFRPSADRPIDRLQAGPQLAGSTSGAESVVVAPTVAAAIRDGASQRASPLRPSDAEPASLPPDTTGVAGRCTSPTLPRNSILAVESDRSARVTSLARSSCTAPHASICVCDQQARRRSRIGETRPRAALTRATGGRDGEIPGPGRVRADGSRRAVARSANGRRPIGTDLCVGVIVHKSVPDPLSRPMVTGWDIRVVGVP